MNNRVIRQAEIDRANVDGTRAYFRDEATQGQGPKFYTNNPHTDAKLRLAWQRGYNQDSRRVIAD